MKGGRVMKRTEIDRIECAIRHIKASVDIDSWAMEIAVEAMEKYSEVPNSSDCISRQAAIDAVKKNTFRLTFAEEQNCEGHVAWSAEAVYSDVMEGALLELPSAQLGQRYTNEELMIFQHGISLSLLSKRSAQHWRYDENTATEIKFLERLYEKVSANMRGGQNE